MEIFKLQKAYQKDVFKIWQNSQENTCAGVSFSTHVFSCKFCEIFKNTFSTEQLRPSASTVQYHVRIMVSHQGHSI